MASFIWTSWNTSHIAEHGVTADEAEFVVESARPPYPAYLGDDKFLVRGQTAHGRYLQVIYVMESAAEGIDWTEVDLTSLSPDEDAFYVIHARRLTPREKAKLKRRRSG